MKFILSLCFSFLFLTLICAQDLVLTPIGETFCSPGVINKSPSKGLLLEYGFTPDVRLKTEGSSELADPTKVGTNSRFKIKLKAPILNKERLKVLVGWNYYGEEYNFEYIGQDNASIFNNIDDKALKSSRISLYLVKPINHKYYFALKAVTSHNGDYDGILEFDKRYTRYDVATIFGVKKRTNIEWGVGLLFRKSFDNNFPVVPFGLYNHTFNSKWGIESILPTSIMGRYNINNKSMLLFGPQYESRTYAIDITNKTTNESAAYIMRRAELRFALRYERNIGNWLWVDLSSGYVHNFSTRFEQVDAGSDAGLTKVTPSNGPFFKIGLFISPPRDRFK